MSQDDFDGKRLRKSVMRKTVDYNSAIVRALEVCVTMVLLIKNFVISYNNCISGFFLSHSRRDYGNVTIVTDEHCNQKAFMHLKCYHRLATWITRLMQLRRGS